MTKKELLLRIQVLETKVEQLEKDIKFLKEQNIITYIPVPIPNYVPTYPPQWPIYTDQSCKLTCLCQTGSSYE